MDIRQKLILQHMLGRHPRSHLDIARPDLQAEIHQKQTLQQTMRGGKERKIFGEKSKVFAKSFTNSTTPWLSGIIQSSCGPKSYLIELSDGRIIRRHVDHLRERASEGTPSLANE